MQFIGKLGGVLLYFVGRRHAFGKEMHHVVTGQYLGDQVRPDRLLGPCVPAFDEFTPIFFYQTLDCRLVDVQDSSKLPEETEVNVTRLLKSDNLVGCTDEALVSQEFGDLSWAEAQDKSSLPEVGGEVKLPISSSVIPSRRLISSSKEWSIGTFPLLSKHRLVLIEMVFQLAQPNRDRVVQEQIVDLEHGVGMHLGSFQRRGQPEGSA